MEEKNSAEKPRRPLLMRLWWLHIIVLLIASLCVADWLLETRGLPAFLSSYARKRLAAEGITLSAEKIRCGIWRGIRLDHLRLESGRKFEAPSFSASKVHATFSPFRLLHGDWLPLAFEVENGRLSVPIFPETGEEGSSDCLVISDFNGTVAISGGRIIVENAGGKLQNMEFRMSGYIDKLLSAAGARGGAALHEKLSSNSAAAKPQQQKTKTADSLSSGIHHVNIASASFMTKIPVQFRRRFIRILNRLDTGRFAGKAKCEINFAIDLADFRRSIVKMQLNTPAFNYGNLKIGSMKQDLSLKEGVLEFKDIHIELGGGEYIEASGACDTLANSVSGQISGLCGASKLMLFLDESTRRRLSSKFHFGDDLIAFKGSLQNFSPATGRYNGSMEFHIPNLVFNGVSFGNLSGNASIDEGRIAGRVSGGNVDNDGEIEGDFSVTGDSIDCRVEGSAGFETAKRFLPAATIPFVEENVRITSEDKLVSFSGSLKAEDFHKNTFSGAFDILAPQLRFKDMETKMLSLHLDFKGNVLKLSDIHATLDDGTKLSGEAVCDTSSKVVTASMICLGSPERVITLLGPEQRGFLKTIIRDIDWPLAGNRIESAVDLHYRYGADPFCFMTGSLAMTDFEYRGIKFKYGATRFIIDSDRLLILPSAVLETKDGQALISICYRAAGTKSHTFGRQPDSSSFEADSSPAPGGKLDYELASAISGNDLLRCFHPQWKSEYIDFAKSLQVVAKGVIDYKTPEKSYFNAKIQNGTCTWKGATITNIDASVVYGERRLRFKGASAEASGGKLGADYDFSFQTLSGDVGVRIQDAELQPLMKQIGWGEIVGNGKPGKLSGELASKISYSPEGALLMDGGGKLLITSADLWSIPLFGEFLKFLGRAWSLDSLGSITTVSADYKLVRDHFETDSVKSDGGFVALSGNGKYYWNTNDFDFKFRAELLKGALPFETMSRLLSPISWVLERRLHGKDLNYKWD